MSGRKKHRGANEYLQYLKGELSNQERHSFEKELEGDPFGKEALEGLETLTPEQSEEDILLLHSRMRKRLGKKRRIAWYSAAASIASLLIIGTIFLQIYDLNPEVAEETFDEEVYTPPQSATPKGSEPKKIIAEEMPEESAEELAEEQEREVTRIPAQEEKDEAKSSKGPGEVISEGPSKVAEVQVAEAPMADVIMEDIDSERVTHVEAEAIPQDKEDQYDYIVAETKAAPIAEETPDEDAGRRARIRSERLNQAAAGKPEEIQKKAFIEEPETQLVSHQVSGIVVSGEDMEPLPGATVVMKGSNTGVITDMDGFFNLPVQDDSNSTIVASFVGMETQEYQFEESEELQLVMQPDALTLDEVVVVGRGIQPTGVPTGAYSTVKLGDEIPGSQRSAQPSDGYRAFKQYIEENIQFPEVKTTSDRVVVVL
ncbi:MAG: carboxypeptidase-like regulatory domain-containing protein, partial [Bacteroidota bacterium]